MTNYNKKEYLKYVANLKKDDLEGCEISFEDWEEAQPIANKGLGLLNKIIKDNIK